MNRYGIALFFVAVTVIMPVVMGGGISQATAQTETAASGSIIDLENEEVNIQLQAQQRTVEHGEPVILILSAASYVTNSDSVTVQLIVESSSGVSITGGTAEQGSGSQFSTVTTLNPGSSESLRVVINPNEPGTYEITTEVVYFIGDNKDSGSGERTSISVNQNLPSRDIIWWTPTIIGFISGGVIAAWLLRPPNADMVKNWRQDVSFWSTLVIVSIGSISVCFAGTWFAIQSMAGTSSNMAGTPFEVGFALSFIAAIVGIVLTGVSWMGEFTGKVRLGYGFLSIVCVLGVPIQIVISLVISVS